MAEIKNPPKVLPIVGLIFVQEFDVEAVLRELQHDLGDDIVKSDILRFIHTHYYEKEMGSNLLRQWCIFTRLIMPDMLIQLKHKSNSIEKHHLNDRGGRKINIDPGVISLSNLVLASAKNYSHRIYLSNGIYGEVTLVYENKTFKPLAWTYPDYREKVAIEFFKKARDIVKQKLGEAHLSSREEE